MDLAYPVYDVSTWQPHGAESAGLDEKLWLLEPQTLDQRWLFKPVTLHRDWSQGEDWSEKLSTEIGHALGVPCARVELAVRDGRRGSISLNLRPSGWNMHAGSDLLAGLLPGYTPMQRYREGHTLENIAKILHDCTGPPKFATPMATGFEVFSGFMVFDALIANRDRHEQNWSVLQPPPGQVDALAHSYDHASSLGFNLRDSDRERRVENGSIESWAARGTAWRFEHSLLTPPPTLVNHAASALALAGPAARAHWISAVAALDAASIESMAARVPNLSQPSRRFVSQLLMVNRRRILDEC